MGENIFELNRLERNCSNEIILEEMRRVTSIIKSEYLTRKEFDKHSKISSSRIVQRFGSWKDALRKADLENYYAGRLVTVQMKNQKWRGKNDEEFIEELRRVANLLHVQTLTITDFKKHATIHPESIRRRFGSWATALETAGLKLSTHGVIVQLPVVKT